MFDGKITKRPFKLVTEGNAVRKVKESVDLNKTVHLQLFSRPLTLTYPLTHPQKHAGRPWDAGTHVRRPGPTPLIPRVPRDALSLVPVDAVSQL